MKTVLLPMLATLAGLLRTRALLHLEILALRQQLAMVTAREPKRLRRRLHSLGIAELPIAPRSPWQSPYVERLIGSIRRECLDHVIAFNERHLRRLLGSYARYYLAAPTHLSLDKQCPKPRPVDSPDQGHVIAFPHVGGLHHEYRRPA